MAEEKPITARVVVKRCACYDVDAVLACLKEGIALLGGLDRYVQPEERILLKPNMVLASRPEQASTTHPAVLEACIRLLREAGYSRMTYGDSPGFGSAAHAAAQCGFAEVAERYGVPLADFTQTVSVRFPEGKACTSFEIAQGVRDADGIVNLCKMKSHGFMRLTGAVKNTFGCVNGIRKAGMHAVYQDSLQFARMLADLNLLVRPRLHIMDGIVAMDGEGPTSGKPFPMGLLLISDDPVALDRVFCEMVQMPPAYVPTIEACTSAGVGCGDWEHIQVLGDCTNDTLHELARPEFDAERIPSRYEARIAGRLLRKHLYVRSAACVRCGRCVEVCPLPHKAISIPQGAKRPVYNQTLCIRCCCCQEMCPEGAIHMRTPLLGRMTIYRHR